MARLVPWAFAEPAAMTRAFAGEADRWRRALAWETANLWAGIARARETGQLPGLAALRDDGRLAGWTYFLRRDDDLQVGALSADTPADTAALVDGVLARPEAGRAGRLLLFAFCDAPDCNVVLSGRGFAVEDYLYLERPVGARQGPALPGRSWAAGDLEATVALLRAAYPMADPLRPFASDGQPAAWRRYVDDLVEGDGCGRYRPQQSVVVPGAAGTLDAAALVTDLGVGSAHLAQIAVRPERQGQGLATALVEEVGRRCAEAGAVRLTLLVAAANTAARQLYARTGFVPRARFTCAVRVTAAAGARRAAAGQAAALATRAG